jgi:hypothetical protein
LANPDVLLTKLSNVAGTTASGTPVGTIGYRREIEQAAEIVRQDPTARVILDSYLPETVSGQQFLNGADILDTTNKRAYQLKSVSGSSFVKALNVATEQLNGLKGPDLVAGSIENAPPGYAKIAILYIEPNSSYHQRTQAELERKLSRLPDVRVCQNGVPLIDQLIMVTAAGTFSWSKEQISGWANC